MDFGQFDSRAAGDKGAWMHVNHPGTGKPMFDGDKPCRVRVLGIEGQVGSGIMADARKAMREPKSDDSDDDAQNKMVKEAKPLLVEFENIDRGDRPATAPDDVEWFLRLQSVIGGNKQSFVEQVRAFALDRGKILGNGLPS